MAIFTEVISEGQGNYGHDTDSTKAKKTARLEKGLKSAIGKVKMKAAKGAVKAYGAYRDAKASAKMKAEELDKPPRTCRGLRRLRELVLR